MLSETVVGNTITMLIDMKLFIDMHRSDKTLYHLLE